jgi:hypothetical protein
MCFRRFEVSMQVVIAFMLQHLVAAMLLLYSVVVSACLRLVECIDVLDGDDGFSRHRVLRSEPTVECYVGVHAFAGPLAWLTLLVFCVGFPVIAMLATPTPSSRSGGRRSGVRQTLVTAFHNALARIRGASTMSALIHRNPLHRASAADTMGEDADTNVDAMAVEVLDGDVDAKVSSSPDSGERPDVLARAASTRLVNPFARSASSRRLAALRLTLQSPPAPLEIALARQYEGVVNPEAARLPYQYLCLLGVLAVVSHALNEPSRGMQVRLCSGTGIW